MRATRGLSERPAEAVVAVVAVVATVVGGVSAWSGTESTAAWEVDCGEVVDTACSSGLAGPASRPVSMSGSTAEVDVDAVLCWGRDALRGRGSASPAWMAS